MRTLQRAALAAALPAVMTAALISTASPAAAKTQWFEGTLVHVSTDNLKVTSDSGQEMTFLIVPRFGNVFDGSGRKAMQMKDLHSGETVKVYYDTKFLGRPHADRILVLNARQHAVRGLKS